MNLLSANPKRGAACVKFAEPMGLKANSPEIIEIFGSAAKICQMVIDGAIIKDPKDIIAAFASQFTFPAYFGGNWDALEECLTDLSWLQSDRFLVVIREPLALYEKLPSDFQILIEILGNTCRYWNIEWPMMNNLIAGIHFGCIIQCTPKERKTIAQLLTNHWPSDYIEGLSGLLET